MSVSSEEIKKWEALEEEAEEAKRVRGDVVEAAAHRKREMDGTLLRNKEWQRARRRDAREQLVAALGGGDDDGGGGGGGGGGTPLGGPAGGAGGPAAPSPKGLVSPGPRRR
jgi:hypothetical protein